MTNKRIKEILFDSEIHKWNENESEFGQKINGKKNVLILIEDERQNLFGGYIGNEVRINNQIKDKSCYVFSFRKDGEYRMKRFERNQTRYSYWIPDNSRDCLIAFGIKSGQGKDITLYKKEYSIGYCEQICYDYKGEQFALTGKMYFNIKRIVVYQLK